MSKPKIFITRKIPQLGYDLLSKDCELEVNPHDRPLSPDELVEAVKGKDGVICLLSDKINARLFDASPSVKGWANFAVGYDNMDVAEATKRGIPLSNTPDVLTEATAEMAWALLFAVGRRVVESDVVVRGGKWAGWAPLEFIGGDVQGATLGILGAGRIGSAMARKSAGFKMRVLYTGNKTNLELERELGAKRVSFDELVAESDFLSIHVPLRPDTRHLFTYEVFRRMKRSAYLINTARGAVLDEADLVRALNDGLIAGAGLDVYEFEPKIVEGLAACPNAVLAAHTASATTSSRNGIACKAATNVLAMVRGERAPDCINPQVYQ